MSGGNDWMRGHDGTGKDDMDLIRLNKIVIRLFISYASFCVMWNHICYGFAHWASRSPPQSSRFCLQALHRYKLGGWSLKSLILLTRVHLHICKCIFGYKYVIDFGACSSYMIQLLWHCNIWYDRACVCDMLKVRIEHEARVICMWSVWIEYDFEWQGYRFNMICTYRGNAAELST